MKCIKAKCIETSVAVVLSGFGFSSIGWAATSTPAKQKPSAIPTILRLIEKKYSAAATLVAEFTQINHLAGLNQDKTSQGRIFVKKPGKLRWETFQPDANILISDGRKFWFYTPPFDASEHGQVMERSSNQVQSRLAHALLSGEFSSTTRDMKIKQNSNNEFALYPLRGSAGTVTRATIQVDPVKKTIQKVTLDHEGGNHAEISLSKIELGKKLDDGMFHFTPPPNTDRIQ